MAANIPLYVIIPCLNRHNLLSDLLNSIDVDPDYVIIIDTGSKPTLESFFSGYGTVISEPLDSERNIQRWWNMGLSYAREVAKVRGQNKYHIAILNSDLSVNRHDLTILQEALEASGCSISHPDHSRELVSGELVVKTEQGPVPFQYKMTGYCFVIDSELGLDFDENLKWWFGEDDFEWRARVVKGVARVGGTFVVNLDAQGSERDNPDLPPQTLLDEQLFIRKWKALPCH